MNQKDLLSAEVKLCMIPPIVSTLSLGNSIPQVNADNQRLDITHLYVL
jgi:hypothetical protein